MVTIEPSIPAFALVGHHGTLGIARSLGRLGVDVYGVDRDISQPIFRSRYFAGAFEWDVESKPAKESVEFLSERAKETGQRPLLIPTSDDTALFVAENAAALSETFVFANQDATLIEQLASKQHNYKLAQAAGIPVPETTTIFSPS